MNSKVLESKKAIVAGLNEHLDGSNCVIVVSYQGLPVSSMTQLRKGLKKVGAKMEIHKNTLLRRAIDGEGYQALDSILKGPNALITSHESTSALPVLQQFAKKNKALVIKGAVIEKTYCDPAKIEALANVGGKEGALSMLLSVLEAPIRQFAVACKAVAEKQQ